MTNQRERWKAFRAFLKTKGINSDAALSRLLGLKEQSVNRSINSPGFPERHIRLMDFAEKISDFDT